MNENEVQETNEQVVQQQNFNNTQNNQSNQKNENATVGLVLGIVSLVCFLIGLFAFGILFGILSLVLGIIGIVFSCKGRKSPINKSYATAGLVLSIIGTALGGIELTCVICVVCTVTSVISSI